MNAFILQTIALSLGAFLLGLFLGWLLKKLFCKNKSKTDAYDRDNNERADPSFATSNTQLETDNTEKNNSVAAKTAGVTAIASTIAMAKKLSKDDDHIENISAVDRTTNSADQAIENIKNKTEAVSSFGENALNKVKNELPNPNSDDINNKSKEKLDDIQALRASNLDKTIELKANVAVESSDESIEKVTSKWPDSETLAKKLEDIKSTLSDKTENLQNTTDKVTKGLTSSTASIKNTAKAAVATAAGVATTVVGASLTNKENNKKESTDISSEKENNQSINKPANNKISKIDSSKRDIDYTAASTIHRTIRHRHRSCRCRR